MKHQTSIIILLLSTIISLNCFAEVQYKEAKGRNYVRAYSSTDIAEIEEQLDMNAQDCRVRVYPRDWKKNILHKKNLQPKENEHRHHYHRNKEYYSIIKAVDVYRFYYGNEKCTVTVKKRIVE